MVFRKATYRLATRISWNCSITSPGVARPYGWRRWPRSLGTFALKEPHDRLGPGRDSTARQPRAPAPGGGTAGDRRGCGGCFLFSKLLPPLYDGWDEAAPFWPPP